VSAPRTRAELERAGYKLDNISPCRGRTCSDRVQWVITPAGKKAPYDLMPEPESLAISHFATCPDQARFRRKA
jgi:hypothetical protein